jgi:hypothetical protein
MAKLPTDVLNSLKRQAPRQLKKDFNKEFKDKFEKTKKELIEEFIAHPVTIEISSGPFGSNISGTLGGVSNLFAFIGFQNGDNPTDPILKILNNITYRESGNARSGIGKEYTIDIPTSDDIFAVTPMPWATGRSWAKGIETGISGIGYLLNKSSRSSRSGVAIQAEKKIRGGSFKNVPYISALIKKYNKKFKGL